MTAAPPETLTLDRLATPIGTALLVSDERGVLRAFNWTDYEDAMSAWIARRYPRAERRDGGATANSARFAAYFEGDLGALAQVSWYGAGTPFQQQVWAALCDIPVGETLSYAGLAARVGRPAAVRAVGLANGSNPVAVVVPCHRVIGSDGTLTGYGGGLPRKRWLLQHERAAFRG